jgi:hypothetical protein
MTQRTSPQPAKQAASRAFCTFGLAAFTIGTKSSNTINVAVQLQDNRGQAIQQIGYCDVYLSDNADGTTLTATALTSNIVIGTNGVIIQTTVTEKAVAVISNKSGQFDLNLIQTASPQTYYMVVCMPDGSVVVSNAITF